MRCVLFDLDNTLVEIPDTYHFFDDLIIKVIQDDYGLPVPEQASRDTLWRSGKDYIPILQSWGVSDPSDFWRRFDAYDSVKRADYIQKGTIKLYPDTYPALEDLKNRGLNLGIVSNTTTPIVETEIRAFNIDQFFDLVIGLGETQAQCKPEPDGLLAAIRHLGCSVNDTVFVGDSRVDLLAGKRAKIRNVLIDRKNSKNFESDGIVEKDFIRIHDLRELIKVL